MSVLAWSLAAVPPILLAFVLAIGADEPTAEEILPLLVLVGFLAFAVVGALLASNRAGGPIGWLLILTATSFMGSLAIDEYTKALPALEDAHAWLLLTASIAWIPLLGSISLAMLLFPTGALPSRRWRAFVLLLAVYGASRILVALGTETLGDFQRAGYPADGPRGLPNPIPFAATLLAIGSAVPDLGAVSAVVLFAGPLIAILARARRADRVERQQLKWFLYAAVLVLLTVCALTLIEVLGFANGPAGDVVWLTLLVAFTLLPLAIGTAVLKHRLYDIDVLINRTLVYGALSAVLGASYVASVLVLQTALRPFTAGSDIAVAISTLAVVALFQPLRRRIQDGVDRRFYRARYDAGRTLDTFSARLRNEVELEAVRADLLGVVGETMRPTHASVWLRGTTR